jgi:hypothetical protein
VLTGRGFVFCDSGNEHQIIEIVHDSENNCLGHSHDFFQLNNILEINYDCSACEDTLINSDHIFRVKIPEIVNNSSDPTLGFVFSSINDKIFQRVEKTFFSIPPPRINSVLVFFKAIILII